ncbi:hypothetical protein AAVH_04301 [Aphelenchoides avenae]|nr:hypothetical protein AAVH_04301 [Aphelenchus avenae]
MHGATSVAYFHSNSVVAFSTNNLCTEWKLEKPVSYRELIYPLERGPGHYKFAHVGPSVLRPGSKVTPYLCRGCHMSINVTVVFGDREAYSYYSNCNPNVGVDLGNGKRHGVSCVFTTSIHERRTSGSRGTGPERRAKNQASASMAMKRARQRHNLISSNSVKESLRQSTSKDCVPRGNQRAEMNMNQGGFQIDPMATIFVSTTVRSFRTSGAHLAWEKFQKSME